MGSTGLRTWTQRFTIASTGAYVAFLLTTLLAVDDGTSVLIAVFGFVCPMIFGMAYLLLPAYAGTTLVDHRLAGVHFLATYVGVSLLVSGRLVGDATILLHLGSLSWTVGVVIFVGSLFASVGPTLVRSPTEIFRGRDRPQRSTRLATATIPIAIGYLLVGTIALVVVVTPFPSGAFTLQHVVHYYLVGFGALLIYSLGARLLLGFFHVSLPRALVWTVLVPALIAPLLLGTYLWVDPWFRIGGVFTAISMAGYISLVTLVARRTRRVRVGLSGIVLGAIAGGAAVAASLPVAFGLGTVDHVAVHRTFVLAGFFPLTIVGYAYLFFPVSEGQFPGASARFARATIGLLGLGVTVQAIGIATQYGQIRIVGAIASIAGAIGYGYLLGRRFVRD